MNRRSFFGFVADVIPATVAMVSGASTVSAIKPLSGGGGGNHGLSCSCLVGDEMHELIAIRPRHLTLDELARATDQSVNNTLRMFYRLLRPDELRRFERR